MKRSVIKAVLRNGAAGALLLLHGVSGLSGAHAAQFFKLRSGESLEKFAARITGAADQEDIKLTKADWNGHPFVFVEYLASKPVQNGYTEENCVLAALEKMPDGSYQKIDVTVGEEDGGTAHVEAIAFANADKDPAKELIVLLGWDVKHYDVEGMYYEVRIFDDLRSDGTENLTYLKPLSEHFGTGCACYRRDGNFEHYRFKTISAIKQELKRLGY